jgi:signal transduction histidine kinase
MASADEMQTETLTQELADLRAGIAVKNRLLAAFEQIGQPTLSSLDLEQQLDTLATQVIKTGLFRSLMIALVEEETDSIVVVRSLIHQGLAFNKEFALDEDVSRPAASVPIQTLSDVVGFRYSLSDDNITAMTARTGEMQVLDEWSEALDERYNNRQERRGKVAYFIPVKREDRVLAVMATGSQMEDKEAVLARIDSMQPLLAQIAIALEHAKLYAQVQKESAERERAEQALKTQRQQLISTNRRLEEKEKLVNAFHQMGQVTLASLDLDQILDTLAGQLIETGMFRSLTVALVRHEQSRVDVVRNYVRAPILQSTAEGTRTVHQGAIESHPYALRQTGRNRTRPDESRPIVGLSYPLDDANIMADVARSEVTQVVRGWDPRFSAADSPTEPQVIEAHTRKASFFIPVKQGTRVLAVLATGSELHDCDEMVRRIAAMQPLLGQVAVALEHARLYDEVRVGKERMQALSRRLVQVQEEERRSLARELHDEIGQTLTGLNLILRTVPRQQGERMNQALNRAQKLVHELATNVHDLSLELRPSILDDHGLLHALASHFLRYTEQTQVEVVFKHDGLDRGFDEEVKTAAYRIVQEALTNVARHAEVPAVHVRVWSKPKRLHIQVEDEGIGFNGSADTNGVISGGLTGMKERALLLGGTLTIDTTPGRGTCLLAELPLGRPSSSQSVKRASGRPAGG